MIGTWWCWLRHPQPTHNDLRFIDLLWPILLGLIVVLPLRGSLWAFFWMPLTIASVWVSAQKIPSCPVHAAPPAVSWHPSDNLADAFSRTRFRLADRWEDVGTYDLIAALFAEGVRLRMQNDVVPHHGGTPAEMLRELADMLDRYDATLMKLHITGGKYDGKTIADITGLDAEVQSDLRWLADQLDTPTKGTRTQ